MLHHWELGSLEISSLSKSLVKDTSSLSKCSVKVTSQDAGFSFQEHRCERRWDVHTTASLSLVLLLKCLLHGALLYLLHSELKISLTPTGGTWQDPLRLFFLSECSAISPSWLSGPRFTPTSCSGSGKYGYPLDASTPPLITSCAPHPISWIEHI